MGVVLKAFDNFLGIDVAIKVLNKDDSGIQAARLQREAVTAGKLNHPNVGKILDFARTSDDTPYMVMEYLEGHTLAQCLEKDGALTVEAALVIFTQICEGLGYAHNAGIVHRDLKPSNVMLVGREGRELVKVVDFGVAKNIDATQSLTTSGAVVGSAPYMSPEQSAGVRGDVDSRSDIYSFGCLMYETLVGKPPFLGQSALETISMHRNSQPPALEAKFPQALQDLVARCLQKDPGQRPQSTDEIVVVLDTLASELRESRSAALRLVTPTASGWMFKRSNAMTVGVGLCILGLLGAAFLFARDTQQERKMEKSFKAFADSVDAQKVPSTKEDDKYHTDLEQRQQAGSYKTELKPDGRTEIISNFLLDDDQLKDMKSGKIWRLDLEDSGIKGTGLAYLLNEPIEQIDLKGTQITDESCKFLPQFSKLTKLEIDSEQLSDEGLKNLSSCRDLRTLRLCSPKITNKGIEYLTALPKLESLEISTAIQTRKGKILSEAKPSGLTNACFTSLKRMKTLKYLSFLRSGMNSDCGDICKQMPQLTSFSYDSNVALSTESFKAFGSSNLKALNLVDTTLSDEACVQLSKCTNLEELYLRRSKFAEKSFLKLSKLPSLITLSIERHDYISDALIDALLFFKVKALILDGTNIKGEQLERLAMMGTLEMLSFSQCDNLDVESINAFEEKYWQRWHKKIRFRLKDTELWRQ